MELLIFSDSHGRTSGMREALSRHVGRLDAILYLGDGLRDLDSLDVKDTELYCVAGNCDRFSFFSGGEIAEKERLLFLEGHTLLLTHGHRYSVKSGYDALLARAVEVGADIVVFGHTHVPLLKTIPKGSTVAGKVLERPTYLFNPGSISTDPDGLGPPFGTLLLRQDTVLFSHGRI